MSTTALTHQEPTLLACSPIFALLKESVDECQHCLDAANRSHESNVTVWKFCHHVHGRHAELDSCVSSPGIHCGRISTIRWRISIVVRLSGGG
jgi:hypothetical protein